MPIQCPARVDNPNRVTHIALEYDIKPQNLMIACSIDFHLMMYTRFSHIPLMAICFSHFVFSEVIICLITVFVFV